jgi:predicted alpha/beta superfamily hydrolase
MNFKSYLLTLKLVISSLFVLSQTDLDKISESDFNIGKTITIQSVILNEPRTLNIYLPDSYSKDSSKSYPVIYLLDGSRNEDFIHIAGLVQFASFSWVNMLPESIVVGIENVDRKRDFTFPTRNKLDQKEFPSSGKSELFIDFIKVELQPFINSNFRTINTKTLIGQSLGGLLATEILLKKPNLFSHYIIVSPSLWWDNESLLSIEGVKLDSTKSIYIGVGKEGEIMERVSRELYNKLTEKKSLNTKVFYEYLEDNSHGDALHNAVYNGFSLIFESKNSKH